MAFLVIVKGDTIQKRKWEKFEAMKGVIRRRDSRNDRQYNGLKEKGQST